MCERRTGQPDTGRLVGQRMHHLEPEIHQIMLVGTYVYIVLKIKHLRMHGHMYVWTLEQQVAGPQHVGVCEIWVQSASGVGPFSTLSNLLGGHEWLTDCCLH